MTQPNKDSENQVEQTDDSHIKGLNGAFSELGENFLKQLAELVKLLNLEISYSGLMVAIVLAMALVVGITVFSIWALLLAATTSLLLTLGMSLAAALLILAVANILILLLALWFMRWSLARIGLPRTQRALGLEN